MQTEMDRRRSKFLEEGVKINERKKEKKIKRENRVLLFESLFVCGEAHVRCKIKLNRLK